MTSFCGSKVLHWTIFVLLPPPPIQWCARTRNTLKILIILTLKCIETCNTCHKQRADMESPHKSALVSPFQDLSLDGFATAPLSQGQPQRPGDRRRACTGRHPAGLRAYIGNESCGRARPTRASEQPGSGNPPQAHPALSNVQPQTQSHHASPRKKPWEDVIYWKPASGPQEPDAPSSLP